MNKESYTAASIFPTKLLHQQVTKNGKIIPVHIQLIPTNACNLSCDFCSCSDRDKSKKLSLDQMIKVIDTVADRGTKAMTITGGGEPLMHSKVNGVIKYAGSKGIQSGLVTNGILLNRLDKHDSLTWCRISSSDDRTPAYDTIASAVNKNTQTDFAFSHVITEHPNYETIRNLINFANHFDFSHVRLVSDLLNLDKVPSMEEVKKNLSWCEYHPTDKLTLMCQSAFDDRRVIYQGRKDSTKGTKDCYISLLKPIIAPEGIFACCGIQYAIHGQPRDMVKEMSMGKIEDLPEILDRQIPFNGSKCDTCFYSQYNSALEQLLTKPEHLEFV